MALPALITYGSSLGLGRQARRDQIPSAARFSSIQASIAATASLASVSTASLPPVTPGRSWVTSLTRFGAPVTKGTGFTCVYRPKASAAMASMVAFCSMYSGAVATTGNAGTFDAEGVGDGADQQQDAAGVGAGAEAEHRRDAEQLADGLEAGAGELLRLGRLEAGDLQAGVAAAHGQHEHVVLDELLGDGDGVAVLVGVAQGGAAHEAADALERAVLDHVEQRIEAAAEGAEDALGAEAGHGVAGAQLRRAPGRVPCAWGSWRRRGR